MREAVRDAPADGYLLGPEGSAVSGRELRESAECDRAGCDRLRSVPDRLYSLTGKQAVGWLASCVSLRDRRFPPLTFVALPLHSPRKVESGRGVVAVVMLLCCCCFCCCCQVRGRLVLLLPEVPFLGLPLPFSRVGREADVLQEMVDQALRAGVRQRKGREESRGRQ